MSANGAQSETAHEMPMKPVKTVAPVGVRMKKVLRRQHAARRLEETQRRGRVKKGIWRLLRKEIGEWTAVFTWLTRRGRIRLALNDVRANTKRAIVPRRVARSIMVSISEELRFGLAVK